MVEEERINDGDELAIEWKNWLAENLLRQADKELLIQQLVEEGFSKPSIEREIDTIVHNNVFSVGENIYRKLAKLEAMLAIKRQLSCTGQPLQIDRRKRLSSVEFAEGYYSPNRPVVLTSYVPDWPAFNKWSPTYFVNNYGFAKVSVSMNRRNDLAFHAGITRHSVEMTLGEYARLVQSSGVTNDHYLVANNRALDGSSLSGLFEDIQTPPEILDPCERLGRTFLWFGPSGTVTPLHHDTMNICLAQIYGRKAVKLIPPEDTPLLYNDVGVFSSVDLDMPNLDEFPLFSSARVVSVELNPGDMLFIPVGWWHHVRSLSVSIAVSFTNFIERNEFEDVWSS
jgi:hypothetical protein